MKKKSMGLAKRGKQSKEEFDKILESNYEMGDEYYKHVEENRKKMDKNR